MERLTQVTEIGNAYFPKCFEKPCCGMGKCIDNNCNLVNEVCKKLAEYETLEEQGLLVRLPCKVGDIVYDSFFGYPEPHMVKAISYGYCIGYVEPKIENEIIFYCENYTNTMKVIFPMKELGRTVFLTREEAEKKLEEMKKNG